MQWRYIPDMSLVEIVTDFCRKGRIIFNRLHNELALNSRFSHIYFLEKLEAHDKTYDKLAVSS